MLNFDEREDSSFEPAPAGLYKLIVTDTEIKGPGQSGYQYCNFEFAIAEGPEAGKKVWKIMSFSPRAFFNVEEILTALGEDPDKLNGDYAFDETIWPGAICEAVLNITHYVSSSGQPGVRNEIEQGTMKPIDGGTSGSPRRRLT